MNDFLLLCLFAFGYAFGMNFLGRWLRAHGYGPLLDAAADRHDALRKRLDRALVPMAIGTVGALRALHSLPLYGSKKQRATLDEMAVRLRQQQPPPRADNDCERQM